MSMEPIVTVKIEPYWEPGAEMHEETQEPQQQKLAHVKEEAEDKNPVDSCHSMHHSASITSQDALTEETHSNMANGTETYTCDTLKSQEERMQQKEIMLGNKDKDTVTAGTSRRGQRGRRSKNQEQPRSEGGPYTCGICNKTFRHISNLNIHERIHTGEKPYSCEVCKQRFAQVSNLKVHKRIHTGERPYACGTCEQRFTMLSNLKKHERIHTGDKPYSCETCQMKFTLLGNLKTHQRIHTGEKIYSCGACERKFTQLSSLKSHERTHTGEKPFWCDLCQKGYTRKSHLDQHAKKRKRIKVVLNKQLVKSGPV